MNLKKKNIILELQNSSQLNDTPVFLNKDISGVRLVRLNINGQIFKTCTFASTEFYNCDFTDCKFIDCDLNNAKFIDCNLINCNFIRTNLEDIVIEGGCKVNCIFNDMNTGKEIANKNNSLIAENNDNQFLNKIQQIFKNCKVSFKNNKFKLVYDNIELIIAKEAEEYGDNVWRVMVGLQWGDDPEEYDVCASDTIDETMSVNTIKTYVKDVLNSADKYLTDSVLFDESNNLTDLINNYLNLNETDNEIQESSDETENQDQQWRETTITLSNDDINLLEKIQSLLINFVGYDSANEYSMHKLENLLNQYEKFMNDKIRN